MTEGNERFSPTQRRWPSGAIAAAVISAISLGGCSEPTTAPKEGVTIRAAATASPDAPPLSAFLPKRAVVEPSPKESLGRFIFFDTRLSNPPGTSCASCHDPERAFSGNHGSTHGVALGSRPGHFSRRNTPSVLYLKYVPSFHFALEDDDDVVQSPFGGLSWSGRADSIAEFVPLPLFDPDEMNNRDDADVAAKLRGAPYAEAFGHEFPGALDRARSAMDALGSALEAFLTSSAMAPFSSRYDDYIRHEATLTPLEMRGLKLFRNPDKGACDACHLLLDSSTRPENSLFTNYGYDAVAVPRNRDIPANADAARYDLGLCERRAARVSSSAPNWCADFRTPSLRNVAVRERFMHNGAFSNLRDVVAFYATRSTRPALWYPSGVKFDDVPVAYRRNVNVASLPYNRREGAQPALDDSDIDAIVAFLGTLTDQPVRDRLGLQ